MYLSLHSFGQFLSKASTSFIVGDVTINPSHIYFNVWDHLPHFWALNGSDTEKETNGLNRTNLKEQKVVFIFSSLKVYLLFFPQEQGVTLQPVKGLGIPTALLSNSSAEGIS